MCCELSGISGDCGEPFGRCENTSIDAPGAPAFGFPSIPPSTAAIAVITRFVFRTSSKLVLTGMAAVGIFLLFYFRRRGGLVTVR